MLMLLWPLSAQAYFLYQLPDGSRLITDKVHHGPEYKLVRASRDTRNMGRFATRRYLRHSVKAKDYEKLIRHFAHRYDVDIALVKAIIHTESYFNPEATSRVGASGLMQLMPATAERYCVTDIYDPQQNLEAGIRHLRYLLGKYGHRMRHAIAAYNAGETAVKCANYAMRILGAYGYSTEYPVARLYRDAPTYTMVEGSSNICKWIIALDQLGYRKANR